MRSRSRRLAALVWAVVLSLFLSACFASGSSSTSDEASDGGASAGASAGASGGTSDGGGSPSSDGFGSSPGGSGSRGGSTQPQAGAPGREPSSDEPLPVPQQAPGPPAAGQAPAAPGSGQVPAQPPGPAAPNKPPVQETVVLEWLPIGPVGRGDPVWYVDLKERNCSSLPGDESGATMVELAPTLCLGLRGDEAAWARGVAALETMPQPVAGVDDCWSVTGYQVLQNIAAFRKQNPDTPFELVPRPGTACRPDLKFVEDALRNSPPAGVCAGALIILVGTLEGLPVGSVRAVTVGATAVPVLFRESQPDDNYPPGDLYFLAPPPEAGAPTTVGVIVSDADYPVDGSPTFTYADPATCPQASGTALATSTAPATSPALATSTVP